jgi:hypothetical protein
MCIACEMSFWDMIDALAPEERERILRAEVARFACDAPDAELPAAEGAAQNPTGESKP